ncbi:MAG: hypothetical protein ACR2JY_13705, partial [Chloroflexota bacterium]
MNGHPWQIIGRRRLLCLSAAALGSVASLTACADSAGITPSTVSPPAPAKTVTEPGVTSRHAASAPSAVLTLPATAGTAFSVFLPSTGGLLAGWKILVPQFQAANPSLKMEVSPTVDVTKLQTFGQNARVAMFAAHWGLTTDLAVSA